MNMAKGFYTRQEILSQPAAWSAALEVLAAERQTILAPSAGAFRPDHLHRLWFHLLSGAGCGSPDPGTDRPALPGLPGLGTLALSPIFLCRSDWQSVYKTLLVAVSRSGETTETLRACEAFLSDKRGELLTLSCYG